MNNCAYKYARGTIWYAKLEQNENYDHGFSGYRPVLIISANEVNIKERACVVLPLSSVDKYEKYVNTYQIIKCYSDRVSYIQCNAPIKISTSRFTDYIFTLEPETFEKVMYNFKMYMGIIPYEGEEDSRVKRFANTTSTYVPAEISIEPIENTIATTPTELIKNTTTTSTVCKNSINLLEFTNKINKTTNRSTYTTKDINSKTVSPINPIDRDINAPKRGKDKQPRKSLKLPLGYWKVLANNVECWNDRLTKDTDYCIKKYFRKDSSDWSKLVYRVHKFLNNNGYTDEELKHIITVKE